MDNDCTLLNNFLCMCVLMCFIFLLLLIFICDIIVQLVLVQRPINLNVSPHPWFVPISRTHIYPVHIPIAKTMTIKEIAAPGYKKVPNFTTTTSTRTTNKYVLPYHASDKGIVQYKKSPFLVHFPTLKSVVFHRTN